MKKVRVDKWLWAVRIFKSRTLANNACKNGKVRMDGVPLKPSSTVKVGDRLEVRKNNFNLQFEIVKLIQKRVSATLAAPCYIDHTSEAELNKFKSWFYNKASEYREKGTGRPTKKERREIDEFKTLEEEIEDFYNFDEEEED